MKLDNIKLEVLQKDVSIVYDILKLYYFIELNHAQFHNQTCWIH